MDYNIYIHDKTGGAGKPTKPKTSKDKNTSPKNDEEEGIFDGVMQMAGKLGKVAKGVLAAYAATKVVKSSVDRLIPYITRETGDFRFATAWNNTWQLLDNNFHPIRSIIRRVNYYQENMLMNQRTEQQRLLIGDSYINNVSRKV